MKKLFLLAICYLLLATSIAQNIGIGTSAPQEKLHIKDGDVLLENGKFITTKTGRGRNLLPIAVASVSAGNNAALTGGTTNVTVSNYGRWVDIGEDNKGVQAFVTPVSTTEKAYPVITLLPAPNNTKIEVRFYEWHGYQVYPGYNIVVYKTGTDAYREYNITLADDTNGVVITNGAFGISTAAVDSLRITVNVPDTVLIGGGGGYGAGITFTGLPKSTSIKVNNYGKIVGIGGKGGSGGGTYGSGSYQGGCNVTAGEGWYGGPALLTDALKIVVDNYGFIAGGGGGGGGGKAGSSSGANGGGGGAGAGWPIPSSSSLVGGGGNGGVIANAVAQGNYCYPNLCNDPTGCCCGYFGPYGESGHVGYYTTGTNFVAGTGGNGVSGGFTGAGGGALGTVGQSNGNTAAGGSAGKAVLALFSFAAGNVINTQPGGQTVGVVD